MSIPVIRSQSKGSGRPLVLLHAFPLSHRIWDYIQAPEGFRLVLPDFPGFGLSPLTPHGLTLEEAATGLRNHLEESRLKEPVLLGGISMGGYWAMEFVRQFPGSVQDLILISTRPGVDKPENRQKRLEIADKVEKEGTGFLIDSMVPGLLGETTRETKPEVVEAVSQWIRETPPVAVALAQRAMANRRDQTDLLAQVKNRALVMAGLEDTLIPASEAEAMAKVLPNARLKLFQTAGHLIPLEIPGEFQKHMVEFLSR